MIILLLKHKVWIGAYGGSVITHWYKIFYLLDYWLYVVFGSLVSVAIVGLVVSNVATKLVDFIVVSVLMLMQLLLLLLDMLLLDTS
jgi:hypothetical protein